MTQQAYAKPRALVLEDDALIALDLQDKLQSVGYDVAGPCDLLEEAIGNLWGSVVGVNQDGKAGRAAFWH